MPSAKSSFLDKVLGRLGRLDREGLQTVVQRLARERDLLETLFNTIEDGVLVTDEAGRIIYFNRAVTRLLGLQPAAEGRPITRYLPDLDWAALSAWDKAGGPQVVRRELEVSLPRPRILSLSITPLGGQAVGSSGVAFVLHDITQARQQTAAAIETERSQALMLLAASVAHEIGNPLNALHIHLQLIERELKKLRLDLAEASPGPAPAQPGAGPPSPASAWLEHAERLEKFAAVAKGEIARLDYIVTQFLQALRPSPPKFQQAQVNDVVQATLELLQPEIKNRGLTVREKLGRQLPLCRLDPNQIKQALVNLMKNALQAMTKGGVLTVQTEAGEEGVWITVADTGRGIAPDDINRIFEPFYTTKKKGSGLGLMIVQRILRDHGGRIEVQSHQDRGTIFRLWLPLHERPTRLLEARHD